MDTRLSGTPKFLDEDRALACVHCGLCLTACPTYLESGNENDSPRGRIHLMRALQEERIGLGARVVRHLDRCLGCRACETACPSGVQYGRLIEGTRAFMDSRNPRSLFQRGLRRWAIEGLFPYPGRLRWALRSARLLRALGGKTLLPRFARDAIALLPEHAEADRTPALVPAEGSTNRGRVGFLRGCVMSVLFGRSNAATVRLLSRLGYEVVVPQGQGCCGALDAHGGKREQARQWARRNLEAFAAHKVGAVISNAAGCGSTLKEYGELLADDPQWAEAARRFSAQVKDLTEFLVQPDLMAELTRRIGVGSDDPPATGASLVTVHDACHLAHAQQITRAPRDLVQLVAGDRYVELPESDVCCGSAGSYNLTEPDMAGRLRTRKTQNILETTAGTVVTTNPGCILQIQAGLQQAGAGAVQVRHIAEFLLEAWEAKASQRDRVAQGKAGRS